MVYGQPFLKRAGKLVEYLLGYLGDRQTNKQTNKLQTNKQRWKQPPGGGNDTTNDAMAKSTVAIYRTKTQTNKPKLTLKRFSISRNSRIIYKIWYHASQPNIISSLGRRELMQRGRAVTYDWLQHRHYYVIVLSVLRR